MIQWFSKNEKNAIGTIYNSNITINKAGMEMLQDAYAVLLGLDSDDEKIAFQPITRDQYDSKAYPEENMFLLSGGKTYVRVSSTEFVSKVSHLLGYDFKKGPRKYSCYYDQHEGLLILDLKKEIVS